MHYTEALSHLFTKTSCQGNAFRITGHLWGESIGDLRISLTKNQQCGTLMCSSLSTWTRCCKIAEMSVVCVMIPLGSYVFTVVWSCSYECFHNPCMPYLTRRTNDREYSLTHFLPPRQQSRVVSTIPSNNTIVAKPRNTTPVVYAAPLEEWLLYAYQ